MGLFKKKGKDKEKKSISQESPQLPELPKLPEFPEKRKEKQSIPKLPRFPNDSLGDKFSQDTIKQAVTGEKEGKKVSADEFDKRGEEMQKPSRIELPEPEEDLSEEREGYKFEKKHRETEPVFIRIDKFEEALKNFDKVKEQISEVEKLLTDIKSLKEEEEKELESWGKQIQNTKSRIEKIDKSIFSKIE